MLSIARISIFCLITLLIVSCNPNPDSGLIPTITTSEVTSVTENSAASGGIVTTDAGSTVTARGVCWSTKVDPTIADQKTIDGAGVGSITSAIAGLTPNTGYYVRAYATNAKGTGYGSAYQIKTNEANTVADIDGNIYHTIKIGDQTWMVENLKTTRYKDGTAIQKVEDNSTWKTIATGAYCYYNNDANLGKKYGCLYNWFAVQTSKLAPAGWHIPSYNESDKLINYLSTNAGNSLSGAKALASKTDWDSDNTASAVGNNLTINNSSGFMGLPGGYRNDYTAAYTDIGQSGNWWSTTSGSTYSSWLFFISYNSSSIGWSLSSKVDGFSVRCIKD